VRTPSSDSPHRFPWPGCFAGLARFAQHRQNAALPLQAEHPAAFPLRTLPLCRLPPSCQGFPVSRRVYDVRTVNTSCCEAHSAAQTQIPWDESLAEERRQILQPRCHGVAITAIAMVRSSMPVSIGCGAAARKRRMSGVLHAQVRAYARDPCRVAHRPGCTHRGAWSSLPEGAARSARTSRGDRAAAYVHREGCCGTSARCDPTPVTVCPGPCGSQQEYAVRTDSHGHEL
jgi:hypothetical protein